MVLFSLLMFSSLSCTIYCDLVQTLLIYTHNVSTCMLMWKILIVYVCKSILLLFSNRIIILINCFTVINNHKANVSLFLFHVVPHNYIMYIIIYQGVIKKCFWESCSILDELFYWCDWSKWHNLQLYVLSWSWHYQSLCWWTLSEKYTYTSNCISLMEMPNNKIEWA